MKQNINLITGIGGGGGGRTIPFDIPGIGGGGGGTGPVHYHTQL